MSWLGRLFGIRRRAVSPFSASHGQEVALRAAMADAERRLKLPNTARNVRLYCQPGVKQIGPYWTRPNRAGMDEGGYCAPRGNRSYTIVAYCDPSTMAPHRHVLVHECGHVLLYLAGVPPEQHHYKLRGFDL